MYSLAHARVNLRAESSCLPEQLRHIIRFCLHAFDRDAVDFPLLPSANRFCGCFRLGSGPVLFWCFPAFCFAFSAGETQVWLGDLRVVALVCLLVLCFASIDLLISRTVRPCTDVFTAYSHVRTEPLARHRPNSRKKNPRKVNSLA